MAIEIATDWRFVTFYEGGGLHIDESPLKPMVHIERECFDELLTAPKRITAAIELLRKYDHAGCEPGKHSLAVQLIAILEGKNA